MADKSMSEQFYSQVSESIKLVFDLTSRIDERVKILVEHQKTSDERIEKLLSTQNELLSRVAILESRNIAVNPVEREELTNIVQRLAVLESHGKPVKKEIDDLEDKVQELELKTETLSLRTASSESKWSKIIDFCLKLAWVLLAGYILYKLGFPDPL